MSYDLLLKASCSGCGSPTDLYGSNCKHMTLCQSCGTTMAQNRGSCFDCGATLTRLIREYPVLPSPSTDKNYFIGRFVAGLPNFSKKKTSDNKWTLQKEGLMGRQVTDTLREKFKNKPWLLEDEVGQLQFHGQLEGAQSATYYLLMLQGKEFVAIPAGSWYNFNKVAQYKQLTLEEAEEKMNNRRRNAEGYERWMMKVASTGAAAFGESEKVTEDEAGKAGAGGKGRKKSADDEEGNASDKGEGEGEEDEEVEASRKSRLGLNKKGAADDDDGEGLRGGDFDDDDGDVEKGEEWEHDEIFTDDDEAVGIDPEEREDLAPEIPAPPEIKPDDEDEDETNEEEGGLSKSGKELKKLLGRMNDSDEEDDDDSGDDIEDEDRSSPVLAPKVKDAPKEEPSDNSPAKPAGKGTPSTSKSAKGKRKISGDDTKAAGNAQKKVKTENEQKPSVKDEPSKSSPAPKGTSSGAAKAGSSSSQGPVSEDEIRAVLMQRAPMTTQELVSRFKARLKSQEDKKAFADILKRISRISKNNGQNHIVLRG